MPEISHDLDFLEDVGALLSEERKGKVGRESVRCVIRNKMQRKGCKEGNAWNRVVKGGAVRGLNAALWP